MGVTKGFNRNKNILLVCLTLLVMLSAGMLISSLSTSKVARALDDEIHTEIYYAESAYSAGFAYNTDFSTDINNSSAVLSKTYYIELAETTYSRAVAGGNYYFVVAWGRKAEMDKLARYCSQGSQPGDPTFYWDSDDDVGEVGNAIDTGLIDAQYNEGLHDKVYHLYESYALPAHATFPYVGYRVSSDSIIDDRGEGGSIWLPVTVTWAQGKLFDIGIIVVLQRYDSFWPEDNLLNSYYTDSTIRSTIENRVRNASSYSKAVVGAYEKALGIYSGNEYDTTVVTCSYFEMVPGHFNKYKTVTDSFNVYSVYVPDENYIRDAVLARHGGSLAGFDLRYVSEVPALNSEGTVADDTYVETFGSRIIRQAIGFTSFYSGGDISSSVACSISYDDYLYKDFFIKIANSGDPNDPEIEGYFENNLEVCVYPTSVDDTTETGFIHLYFDYQKIFDMFGDTLNWTVIADDLVLYLDKVGWNHSVELPADGYLTRYYTIKQIISADGNRLLDVRVASGHQDLLFGIEIFGTVPIGENVEFDCYIEYMDLSNELVLSDYKTFYAGKWWSHRLGDFMSIAMSRNTTLPINLYNAVSPEILNGIEFVKPVSIVSRAETVDWINHTRTYRVRYEYVTGVVLVTDNIDTIKKVYSLPSSESNYTLKKLGISEDLPSGWRVKSFESSGFIITGENKANALNTEFSLPLMYDKSEPRSIVLELTDKWPIHINYFEQYKNSCFAELKTFDDEIRVADYADIFTLSCSDVSNILGQDVEVLQFLKKSVRIDSVSVSYDVSGDCYFIDLTYTFLSLKIMDSDGNANEIRIGLTPFSFWQKYFGEDWSLMFLAPDVFEFSNEVPADKLYGFFGVTVFKEQLKDFNSWFKKLTGDGCTDVFSVRKVQGSWFYELSRIVPDFTSSIGRGIGAFFGAEALGAGIGTVVGNPLPSIISEFINDDNGEYFTYFFYIDGTSEKSYKAHNGADNYDDNSGAAVNAVEEAGESASNFLSSIWDFLSSILDKIKNSTVVKVFLIVGAVIFGVIVLSLVIKLLMFIFRRRS